MLGIRFRLKRKRSKDQTKAIFAQFAKKYGKKMKRQRVESSNLHSVGYHPNEQMLEVKFIGSKNVYRYSGVPEKVHKNLINANSKGKFFMKKIRGSYPYTKVN